MTLRWVSLAINLGARVSAATLILALTGASALPQAPPVADQPTLVPGDTWTVRYSDGTRATKQDPFENFWRANEIIKWFPNEYKSFASHIGTKVARISALLTSKKKPNHESVEDSFLDLITYCALMYGFYRNYNNREESIGPAWNSASQTQTNIPKSLMQNTYMR